MDPNQWPEYAWLVIALGLGSIVVSLALFLWRATFLRKRPGWFLDSVLLGASGFVLVIAMMGYFFVAGGRITKEWQRTVGIFVIVATGLALMWISRQILKWSVASKKGKRILGSAKAEFSVPEDNNPLPKDIEDEFYK